jgi:hypothetical protein
MKVALPQQQELLFPWSLNVDEDCGYPDAIKWHHNNTSYEVYIHTLEGDNAMHVQNMLPHCLCLHNKAMRITKVPPCFKHSLARSRKNSRTPGTKSLWTTLLQETQWLILISPCVCSSPPVQPKNDSMSCCASCKLLASHTSYRWT